MGPVEDELIIRREIFQNGRSVSRINGSDGQFNDA